MKSVPKSEAHEKYNRLIEAAVSAGAVKTAVAHPCDEVSLKGALEAARLGLIDPILVGPAGRIGDVAKQYGLELGAARVVDAVHSHEAAAKAVDKRSHGRDHRSGRSRQVRGKA